MAGGTRSRTRREWWSSSISPPRRAGAPWALMGPPPPPPTHAAVSLHMRPCPPSWKRAQEGPPPPRAGDARPLGQARRARDDGLAAELEQALGRALVDAAEARAHARRQDDRRRRCRHVRRIMRGAVPGGQAACIIPGMAPPIS